MTAATAILRCTVRGCALPLTRVESRWGCEKAHSFDVTRHGWVNLLQPQDKKALEPGDSAEVVASRRRLLDRGIAAPLVAAVLEITGDLPEGARVLDVGCGEGTHLAAVCASQKREGWGVDISTPAIESAAKRHATISWIVANADRGLPFVDASFDLALSITGRRDPAELGRVLVPGGRALIAVPAADDLAELRAAVQGEAHQDDRLEKIRVEMRGFAEEESRTISHRPRLPPDALLDVLAMTYRGARNRERERAGGLAEMDVTFSWQLAVFRRR